MTNKEYAAAMRQEADKWMQLLPVTKELWLQIADRIEVSPDPERVRRGMDGTAQVYITTAGDGSHWLRRLFFRRQRQTGRRVVLLPFVWKTPGH